METSRDIDKFFGSYKGEKIALYGLGIETQKTMMSLGEAYEIIGLLDSFSIDGSLYGRQIISFDHAVSEGVKLIIVVARPGSCRSIAKKIGKECVEKGIALMDIRGQNLLETKRISYHFHDANIVTKTEIEDKIKRAEVVSFDMFDTLVMRRTLYADDVVEYVNCRLKEKDIYIGDLCRKRMASEKKMARNAAPTLVEIYQNVLEELENDLPPNITAVQLAAIEWDVDFELLVPRKEVCDLFRKAVKCGKRVYVVSDTYYSKAQLIKILEKCSITEYTDIFASSDYGIGKKEGLYKYLKNKEKSAKCLHIGDDIVADVQSAQKYGFETCRLYSGLDLLELLGNLGVQDCLDSLSDHLKIGMFVSNIFNTPFQVEKAEKNIEIAAAYDIGYLFCAPIFSDFILWFHGHMQKEQFQNIWFSARDGYLIRRMYSYLIRMLGQEDQTVYFLTSRIAAIRAGMRNREDICYVDEMQYSGTLEEKLLERFGIDANDTGSEKSLVSEHGLMQYKSLIIEKAQTASENYQKYVKKLNVRDSDIAFFDFVAK